MRRFVAAALLLVLQSAAGAVRAQGVDAHARLTAIARDFTYTMARRHPMTATAAGIPGYDGLLETPSVQYRDEDLRLLRTWLSQVQAIVRESGSPALVDADDAKLLSAQLTSQINALTVYDADEKDYGGPANSVVNAIFTQFQNLPIAGRDGATAQDVRGAWNDITSRLAKSPAYIAATQALVTHPGHLYGVAASEQLGGAPSFLNGALTNAAKAQLSSAAFARFAAARDAALQSIARTKQYIDAHVASWPENYAMGRAAYDRMLRDEQLLPYDTSAVERLAQAELAHGWAVESWLTALSHERGTPFGPQTGGGLAPGGPPLIAYYHARIADLYRFVKSHGIVTIPSWLGMVKVTETPSFLQPVSPGASMNPPLLFSKSTTGYYFITPPKSLADAAMRLDMNEDFDRDRIWSTAAHEVMPGHFLQLSIAKRNPDFIRRIQGSGVFAEGWAFYGEEMFVQLGLYGSDLDGRLYTARWERVRGARAVVDPKLASGEWSFDRAVDFFQQQTGFTHDAAVAETMAIALGPGYFISYTVGRQQLEDLLAQYWLREGARGSLLDFHDRLMCYGTTPFAVVAPELLRDLKRPRAELMRSVNY
ncbi:MAG TPA: DUF885 domain-containing protein [Candidatus Baltobacteraceae bacterium]|jgi:hypothetical protein|nr:DUF885 domain-containing protein [Candidatus Baltobacteraceae bacterium]